MSLPRFAAPRVRECPEQSSVLTRSARRAAGPSIESMSNTRPSWLEAGTLWLYSHYRRRYVWILVGITAISVECVVPVLVVILVPVFTATTPHLSLVMGMIVAASFLGIPTLYWVVRTHHGSAIRYLRGDDPAPPADEVWITSVAELAKGVFLIAAGYWAPLTVSALICGRLLGEPPAMMFVFVYAVTVSTALIGVFFFLIWETAVRPLARELAPQLAPDILLQRRGPSISTKLFILLVLTSLFNGFVVGSLSLIPGSHNERASVAAWTSIAVSLALAGSVIWLLRGSFVSRLDEIRQALDQVEAGAREGVDLAPLAGDDLDDVTRAFNAMTRQLKRGEDDIRMSRSRIVAAADESRKRVERNIHDGAQQRLVALALDLRMLEEQVPTLQMEELGASLRRIGDDIRAALNELRELARGLHPSVLTTDGLGPAVEQLVSRSPVPVSVEVPQTRFPEAVESACYFTAAEAMANVAKYANATEAAIRIEQADGHIRLLITDNGCGGADPTAGSGLTGLVDRIAALDGTLMVDSPAGVGTTLTVELPITFRASPEPPTP